MGKENPQVKINEKGEISYDDFVLSDNVDDNLALFKRIFKEDDTVRYRAFGNKTGTVRCGIVWSDGMVNSLVSNESIVKAVVQDHGADKKKITVGLIESRLLGSNEVKPAKDLKDAIESVLYGDTLLFADGVSEILIIGSKGWSTRSVSEPDNEKALRGPREGFTESILTNVSMVKRKLQTTDLKIKFYKKGTRSGTRICICYLDSLVKKSLLRELMKRLDGIETDAVLDANYIEELIKDDRLSPFKTMGTSEKPDIVAAKLAEGRISVFVDGSPIVLTLPYLFIENFQAPDDYYLNYYFATIGRILRLIAFVMTISIPSVYIAIADFHPEMIPSMLLPSIIASAAGVPFPTILECAAMLVIFEVLRETGVRSSTKIGQAFSIVGGLVVGQAAVEAKLVSAPMVIIVAFTGITGLLIPKLNGAIILIRMLALAFTACFGFYGYYFVMILTIFHINSLQSFGYDYVLDWTSVKVSKIKDLYVRMPWWDMKDRPEFARDRERMGARK